MYPAWLTALVAILPDLLIGLVAAVVGGVIVLAAQWYRQHRVDHSEWPFGVDILDVRPPDTEAKFRHMRVWFHNPTSFPVFVLVEPRDADHRSSGAINIRLAWADRPEDAKRAQVPVPSKGAVEFWVDFDFRLPESAKPPTELLLFVSRITFKPGTSHTYPLTFDKVLGEG